MNCTLAPLLSPAHPEADAGERAALLLLAAVERLHGEPLQLVDRHVVGGFPCGLLKQETSFRRGGALNTINKGHRVYFDIVTYKRTHFNVLEF